MIPAWQVATGSCSHPDYVFILKDEIGGDGWPKTRMVDRLMPVDAAEQDRLKQIKPNWMMK